MRGEKVKGKWTSKNPLSFLEKMKMNSWPIRLAVLPSPPPRPDRNGDEGRAPNLFVCNGQLSMHWWPQDCQGHNCRFDGSIGRKTKEDFGVCLGISELFTQRQEKQKYTTNCGWCSNSVSDGARLKKIDPPLGTNQPGAVFQPVAFSASNLFPYRDPSSHQASLWRLDGNRYYAFGAKMGQNKDV